MATSASGSSRLRVTATGRERSIDWTEPDDSFQPQAAILFTIESPSTHRIQPNSAAIIPLKKWFASAVIQLDSQAGCRAAYSRTVGARSGKMRPFGLTASQPRHASQMDLGIGFSPSR